MEIFMTFSGHLAPFVKCYSSEHGFYIDIISVQTLQVSDNCIINLLYFVMCCSVSVNLNCSLL